MHSFLWDLGDEDHNGVLSSSEFFKISRKFEYFETERDSLLTLIRKFKKNPTELLPDEDLKKLLSVVSRLKTEIKFFLYIDILSVTTFSVTDCNRTRSRAARCGNSSETLQAHLDSRLQRRAAVRPARNGPGSGKEYLHMELERGAHGQGAQEESSAQFGLCFHHNCKLVETGS